MWGTVINYFRFFFSWKSWDLVLLLLGKSHSCRFQPFSSSIFLPSLSSSCSCSPVAWQVRDLTLLKVFAASGLLPACSPLAVGPCGLVQILARLGLGGMSQQCHLCHHAATEASGQEKSKRPLLAWLCFLAFKGPWLLWLFGGKETKPASGTGADCSLIFKSYSSPWEGIKGKSFGPAEPSVRII